MLFRSLLLLTAEIYKYEIPGGQYSNLKPQVESFGLGHKFYEVKEMYKKVNEMLGDIIKVTPSSKVVGDLAIFMIQNELTPENVVEKGKSIDFPDSAVSYFEGMIGQPEGGFPKDLQEVVLKGKKPITCRPGELLEDENFDEIKKKLQDEYDLEGSEREALSYALYPKVFEDYIKSMNTEGSFRYVGSDVFFHGMKEGEVSDIKIAEGKDTPRRTWRRWASSASPTWSRSTPATTRCPPWPTAGRSGSRCSLDRKSVV